MTRPDGDGADPRMSDLETLMWRLEHHSPGGSAIAVVATFETPPAPEAADARLIEVTRQLPRLRDRVAPALLPALPPRWEPDPSFDLGRHVRRIRSAGGGEVDTLLALAEPIVATPFPPDRPPWQMTFVGGLAGGREGLVATFHHSYMDGAGALQLAAALFDFEPGLAASPPPGADPAAASAAPADPPRGLPSGPPSDPRSGSPPEGDRPWAGRIAADLRAEALRTAAVAQSVAAWSLASVRGAVRHPEHQVGATVGLLRSALDVGYRVSRPGSASLARRSELLRLAHLEYPLEAFGRAAGAAARAVPPLSALGGPPEFGCTVNDVFVASVVGGLGRYHEKLDHPAGSVRVGIPVSTRPADGGGELGNWLRALALRVPLDVLDPAVRIRLVHRLVRRAAAEPVTTLADLAAAVAVRLPGTARVATRLLGSFEVLASNLAGSPTPLYLGGARVERLIPFGPRGGAALNVTVLSHDGVMHVGVNLDPAAAGAPDLMIECLRAGFDETLGVG